MLSGEAFFEIKAVFNILPWILDSGFRRLQDGTADKAVFPCRFTLQWRHWAPL